jgi:hypothetical protein
MDIHVAKMLSTIASAIVDSDLLLASFHKSESTMAEFLNRRRCDEKGSRNIVYYLPYIGIAPMPIVLSPFFNPIEKFFGTVKGMMHRYYLENSCRDLILEIGEILSKVERHSFEPMFRSCEYDSSGFDAAVSF